MDLYVYIRMENDDDGHNYRGCRSGTGGYYFDSLGHYRYPYTYKRRAISISNLLLLCAARCGSFALDLVSFRDIYTRSRVGLWGRISESLRAPIFHLTFAVAFAIVLFGIR